MLSGSLPHVNIPSVWERAKGATSGQYEEPSLVATVVVPGVPPPDLQDHRHTGPTSEPATYGPLVSGFWDFGLLRRHPEGHDIRNDRYNQPIAQHGNIGSLPSNGTY